jgi:Domain of unknown function (DUF4190)
VTEAGSPLNDPYVTGAPPPASGTALAALVVGMLSYLCLWGIGGVIAVVLGIVAGSEIQRSNGRKGGFAMAMTGLALGALNAVLFVICLVMLFRATPRTVSVSVAPARFGAIPTPAPPATASGTARAALPPSGAMSVDPRMLVTRIGTITLVDVGTNVSSLANELDEQRAAAKKAHQKLLLWVVAPRCAPCNGEAASLVDPLMQRALENVRLVRVDTTEFAIELERLDIPIDKIPGFALLGPDDRPVDYVHGGEWDADVAHNIAPVLGKFVRGDYKHRRDPWHGGPRDDETPI